MDANQFDALAARLSTHLTRRRSLGVLGGLGASRLAGVDESAAKKKKKKKKKCKRGTKKCNGACIPAANCCAATECGAGATCQNGKCVTPTTSTTSAPNPCAGVAEGETVACGEWHVCGSPIGICGWFCSGEVCAQLPTCKEAHEPCGANCCDPAGNACGGSSPGQCGCSSVDQPCYDSAQCCGPGICVGFVCRLP